MKLPRTGEDIPHLRVGEMRVIEVPSKDGVAAHRRFVTTTACGLERDTTLCTKRLDLACCPGCKEASSGGE